MACIAITGTNTGIGKTYIACGLVRALQELGYDTGVYKPFCSGGREDAELLLASSGSRESLEEINPCWFEEALAPYQAARRAGREIDIEGCLAQYDILSQRHDIMIVEGAGGLLVPIASSAEGIYSIRDFFSDCAGRVLIVASRALGSVNHTWLTVEGCRAAGLPILGIVCNDTEPVVEVEPHTGNIGLIEECTGEAVLAHAGYNADPGIFMELAQKVLIQIQPGKRGVQGAD